MPLFLDHQFDLAYEMDTSFLCDNDATVKYAQLVVAIVNGRRLVHLVSVMGDRLTITHHIDSYSPLHKVH